MVVTLGAYKRGKYRTEQVGFIFFTCIPFNLPPSAPLTVYTPLPSKVIAPREVHCSVIIIMAGHHDPKLLYTIPNVKAYHIQNGEEQDLTPSGPQSLSLLMVPTSSPFADLSTTIPQNQVPDEDFYLHLNLPPELELPMPATTQVYHQPPHSYLIPRWDLGPDSGAFTRIAFSPQASSEDKDTFETILAQCTAFLERAPPPKPNRPLPKYDPRDYNTDGKLGDGTSEAHGQIVLIDEDDGSVVGELAGDAHIVEDAALKHGTKSVYFSLRVTYVRPLLTYHRPRRDPDFPRWSSCGR